MNVCIDTQGFDISMGTGSMIFLPGGGMKGNISITGNISVGNNSSITFSGGNIITNTTTNYDWISRASAADYTWNSVCFGNNLFVAVSGADGSNNSVMTSSNGISWTLQTSVNPGIQWKSITFGNNRFVAVGDSGSGNRVMTSPNGTTWTTISSSNNANSWGSVCYGTPTIAGTPTPRFVAVAYSGTNRIMYSSADASTWTGISVTTYDISWGAVAYGNGLYVAVPITGNYSVYSTDGVNWTPSNVINALRWRGIAYGNGLFVAITDGNVNSTTVGTGGQQLTSHVMTSANGIAWVTRYSSDIGWSSITYGAAVGLFVAVADTGAGSRAMFSTNGISWTPQPTANDTLSWESVTYGKGIFVSVALNGIGNRVMTLNTNPGLIITNNITTDEIVTSSVKIGQNGATLSANPSKNYTWISRPQGLTQGFNSICYGNSLFVAVPTFGTHVITSSDGYTWSTNAIPPGAWTSICYGELSNNNLFVIVGYQDTPRVATSINAVTWTNRTSADDVNTGWHGVCFGYDTSGVGMFVSVAFSGPGGRVMTSPNGINWTLRVTGAATDEIGWRGICYGYDASGVGVFVAVGYSGSGNRSMYSRNGINWTGVSTVNNNNNGWQNVCYGNGTFVAVADTGSNGTRVMYSTNGGQSWTAANYPVENAWWNVCYGNGLFVIVGITGVGNRVMTSVDGIIWTIRESAADNVWNGVCYGNGIFAAVSNTGTANNRVMINDFNIYDNTVVTNGTINAVGGGAFNLMNINPLRAGINIQATNTTVGSTQRLKLGSYYSTYSGSTTSGSAIQSADFYNNTDNPTRLCLQPLGGNVSIGTINSSGYLHIVEQTGTVGDANSGTILIDHENNGGTSSIIFRSKFNRGSDYGYIRYKDDVNDAVNGENARLEIGSENDSGSDHLILQKNGGRVGIGISSPLYPLDVNGNGGVLAAATGRYIGAGNSTVQTATSYSSVSIRASNDIIAGGVIGVTSDKRIKTNIKDLHGGSSLEKLRLLRPVSYDYIDNISQPGSNIEGFIAQDVKEVLPNSLNIVSDFIPNIYEKVVFDKKNNSITFTNFNTTNLLRDVSDNSLFPIQLIDMRENKRKFIIEKVIDDSTVILLVDENESELICSDNSELFCFGQFINDMHILKKEIIFSVGISAMQELDKHVQSLENIIKLQQSQIDMLVKRLENAGF